MTDLPHHSEHGFRDDNPHVPQPGSGHDAAIRPDAPPIEPSGMTPHPRSPEEYTEEPGSHRVGDHGAATDVGG